MRAHFSRHARTCYQWRDYCCRLFILHRFTERRRQSRFMSLNNRQHVDIASFRYRHGYRSSHDAASSVGFGLPGSSLLAALGLAARSFCLSRREFVQRAQYRFHAAPFAPGHQTLMQALPLSNIRPDRHAYGAAALLIVRNGRAQRLKVQRQSLMPPFPRYGGAATARLPRR